MSENQAPQATPVTVELLTALIQEIRKPAPPSEQEQKKIDQAQAMRKQTAEESVAIAEAKKWQQKTCSHLRRDGTSRAVYVKHGNYLLCQKCQVVIRGTDAPKKSAVNTIYDTELFNKLFQMSVSSNIVD